MLAGTLQSRALAGDLGLTDRASSTLDIARVYEAHFRYVFRCLRSLGVRDAVLDDALQDVFLVVQRKLSQFDGRAELRTWLYAIALRIARKYRTRSNRDGAPLQDARDAAESATYANAEATAESNQRLALARAALDALDQEKREVFVLARVEQMSAPEIASVVGVPINTVYSRLRAARQSFEAEVVRLSTRRKMPP